MSKYQQVCFALIIPSPASITPLPANIFHNKLGLNVSIHMMRNVPFCFFASFSIVLLILILLLIKSDSFKYLTVSMIFSTSSFEGGYQCINS